MAAEAFRPETGARSWSNRGHATSRFVRRQRRQHHDRFDVPGHLGRLHHGPRGAPATVRRCPMRCRANWPRAGKKLGVNPALRPWRMAGRPLRDPAPAASHFAEVEVDTDTGFVQREENRLPSTTAASSSVPLAADQPGQRRHPHGHRATPSTKNASWTANTGICPQHRTSTRINSRGCRRLRPTLTSCLIDHPQRGVIGIGEPATIPAAAAIANAVANAIGARVHSLPITPARNSRRPGQSPQRLRTHEPFSIRHRAPPDERHSNSPAKRRSPTSAGGNRPPRP